MDRVLELPGHVVEHHAVLASTSTRARELIESGAASPGLVVIADDQTAGRGRRGNSWTTVPGRSLATSIVLPHPPALHRLSRITILAAVAAARALERMGSRDVTIKWPNDLMRGDHKIGGLLVETARAPSEARLLVVGLGVNLALEPGDLPPELAERAGDAGLPAARQVRDELLGRFVEELDRAMADLDTPRDRENGDEYRRRSWLTGREVDIVLGGREERVHIADVTSEGDLVLGDGRVMLGEHVRLASPPESKVLDAGNGSEAPGTGVR